MAKAMQQWHALIKNHVGMAACTLQRVARVMSWFCREFLANQPSQS